MTETPYRTPYIEKKKWKFPSWVLPTIGVLGLAGVITNSCVKCYNNNKGPRLDAVERCLQLQLRDLTPIPLRVACEPYDWTAPQNIRCFVWKEGFEARNLRLNCRSRTNSCDIDIETGLILIGIARQ